MALHNIKYVYASGCFLGATCDRVPRRRSYKSGVPLFAAGSTWQRRAGRSQTGPASLPQRRARAARGLGRVHVKGHTCPYSQTQAQNKQHSMDIS
eukprot:3925116-Pleurochrysis_carterae.AAC.4